MTVQPRDQYQLIQTALDALLDIGYDTENKKFVSLSPTEERAQDGPIISGLEKIKPIIEQFIKEHGITDAEAAALERAFTRRVIHLKNQRFVFFGRAKLHAAIQGLEAITRAIFQSRLDEWLKTEQHLGNHKNAQ